MNRINAEVKPDTQEAQLWIRQDFQRSASDEDNAYASAMVDRSELMMVRMWAVKLVALKVTKSNLLQTSYSKWLLDLMFYQSGKPNKRFDPCYLGKNQPGKADTLFVQRNLGMNPTGKP